MNCKYCGSKLVCPTCGDVDEVSARNMSDLNFVRSDEEIVELKAALNDTAETWNARYEVAQVRIAELERAIVKMKHMTDPIIKQAREALSHQK